MHEFYLVAERVLSECNCKPFFITFPLYPNQVDAVEPPQCSGIKLACMQVRLHLYTCCQSYKVSTIINYDSRVVLYNRIGFNKIAHSGQSYKAYTIVNYDTTVVNISNFLISTTVEM